MMLVMVVARKAKNGRDGKQEKKGEGEDRDLVKEV